jgi:hypothetical protein
MEQAGAAGGITRALRSFVRRQRLWRGDEPARQRAQSCQPEQAG